MASQRHHPSALRNREPILAELRSLLPPAGDGTADGGAPQQQHALEIASGSGAHVEVFAPAFPSVRWWPTDYVGDSELKALDEVGRDAHPNVETAACLDAASPWAEWPEGVRALEGGFALVYNSNMGHISPWRCTVGMLAGAGRALKPGGRLVVYGPFKVDGGFTTESNAAFDASLRQRDPEWGYRDVSELEAEAAKHGVTLRERREMPANNLLLVFEKQ